MFKAQSGIGVKMTARVYDLQPCHDLLPGQGMLQNLPSAVVAHVLAPPPGSHVLDMCASPGGTLSSCCSVCMLLLGHGMLQNLPSNVVAHVLAPTPG